MRSSEATVSGTSQLRSGKAGWGWPFLMGSGERKWGTKISLTYFTIKWFP
ncbi:MAG: hypothetical protein KME26_33630 [Oscillatoria princeps RMCB-10]|nr:hypothetical protein [Oscillatoria princeps RMCB-10]